MKRNKKIACGVALLLGTVLLVSVFFGKDTGEDLPISSLAKPAMQSVHPGESLAHDTPDRENLKGMPTTVTPNKAPLPLSTAPGTPDVAGNIHGRQNGGEDVGSVVRQSGVFESPGLVDPASLSDTDHSIILQAGGIDTRSGPAGVSEALRFDPSGTPASQPIRYLVQFTGSILPEWKQAVIEIGGKFGDYLPHNAFVIALTDAQKAKLGALPFVQWLDYYHPAYKLSAGLQQEQMLSLARRIEGPQRTAAPDAAPDLLAPEPNGVLLLVQTFDNGLLPYLYQLAESLAGVTVVDSSDERKSRILVEIQEEALEQALIALAQANEIEWIEPHVPPNLNNDTSPMVVQSSGADSVPLWAEGLTGGGQIVGVGDTGLDVDMVFFWDDASGPPTAIANHTQRKVISYYDLAGNGDWDGHDHGTHVAGTIAGKSLGLNTQYNGIAYDARLVFQDIGNGGNLTGIPADLNGYFQQAYDDGARIHSNSWGSDVAGAYSGFAQDADQFMWNNPDFLIVFSAGNAGSATGTVGSPGTAKNIITSGAGHNIHSGYNREHVASFSSHGPTADGRFKPTIVAPGQYLLSADNDATIATFNSGVKGMSGTSMSAPAHAGSAALVRQYFVDGFYPSGKATSADALTPSAALMKSVLINSAINMSGSYTGGAIPGTGQGWGRIVLDSTLYFSGDTHSLFVDDFRSGLLTGEEKVYTFYAQGDQPVKVTLVWTDHHPSLSAASQLVNDLDLVVTTPAGSYRGNVFAQGNSVPDGEFDRLNVEETVLLANPASGAYTISVAGYNIPQGPQPFALVVTGLTAGAQTGTVSFDKPIYQPQSSALIMLNDIDLDLTDAPDTATVHLSASNDAGRDIVLTETAAKTGMFRATVVIEEILLVADGDTMTLTYNDANDGSGNTKIANATAVIDLTAPKVSALAITEVTEQSAQIRWQTEEPTSGTIYFRQEGAEDWQEIIFLLGTSHSITLPNLLPDTRYQVKIEAKDEAGNVLVYDNRGNFFALRTNAVQVLLHDSGENDPALLALSGGSNANGENGLWHRSSYKANSGASAWYYGLEASKTYNTGSRNWGQITTPEPIDLSGKNNARLTFRHILKTENDGEFDIARVQLSQDNVTFNTVFQSVQSATDWEEITIDLTPYLGSTVYIRFAFDTVDGLYNEYEGWLVDDIKMTTLVENRGDIDGDGTLTLADAVTALQVSSGASPLGELFLQGDINGDGVIGLAEAIYSIRELSR